MKLFQDFGVRALISTICCVGFYTLAFCILDKITMDFKDAMIILGYAQTPVVAVIGFYFGTKMKG